MLLTVRRGSTYFLLALILAVAPALAARSQGTQAAPGIAPTTAAPQTPVQTPTPNAQSNPQPPAQAPVQPAPPVRPSLAVVILDAAHGGADPGAHGASGIIESDVVLSFARLLRISLEAQGLRVVLTRQANENPSFDDRSKVANAQRADIFITLHVSSTGQPGTVRVYSLPQQTTPSGTVASPRTGLVPWDRAQSNFVDQSRRLAELIQIQMAQRFHGSPETPLTAPVRQLRTVAAPAVAIEVSSVSVADRVPLDQMGPGLADGVARAVGAFRTIYEAGGK
jgi:N-acetylmuramoyl-L-alanine amidase